jgi:hypothetical protein
VRMLRVIGLSMLLSACASAPRGPILPNGPLQGRLEAGIYHDMRGWFGVATPLSPSDPAYGTLAVTEQYLPVISFVSFLPTQAPGEYYRAYMEDFYAGGHVVPAMATVADSAIKLFGKQLMQARAEPMRLIEEKPWKAGVTSGLLRLYTERSPIEPLLANFGMAEDYTAYILMYVTSDRGKVAVLWAEWPMDCKPCAPIPPGPAAQGDDPIDQALAANGRAGPFMASFQFGKDRGE